MSDAADAEFSPEEVSSQAQGNATALALTALAYLRERGLDPDEYVAFHGRRFAPAWEEVRGRPVVEVARLAALNAVSLGATLRSLSGDDRGAEVLVAGWPEKEFLDMLRLSREDAQRQYDAFGPIMEHLGILILGIVGAVIGGYLLRLLGFGAAGGWIGSIIAGFIGAVILLLIYRMVVSRRT